MRVLIAGLLSSLAVLPATSAAAGDLVPAVTPRPKPAVATTVRASPLRFIEIGAKKDDDEDDGKGEKDDDGPGGDDDDDEGFVLEDIFGFSSGTDGWEAGELQTEHGAALRWGKRHGTYRVLATGHELSYGVTDRIEAAFALATAWNRIRGVPGLEDRAGGGFDGIGGELKVRLVKRGTEGPVGVTLVTEGGWARFDEGEGERERVNAFGFEGRALFDTELVKDAWFLAANLGMETERSRTRTGKAEIETESAFEASLALSRRLGEKGTLGVEASYLAAFAGGFFGRYEGSALFIGPTAFTALSDKVSIKAAFQGQVAGWPGEGRGQLDLDNFERFRTLVQLIVEF